VNSFVVPQADYANMSVFDVDNYDMNQLYDILENQILPMYYERPDEWRQVVKNAMDDVKEQFNSDRMADEYYKIMYNN
jgi:starch phosphorylase